MSATLGVEATQPSQIVVAVALVMLPGGGTVVTYAVPQLEQACATRTGGAGIVLVAKALERLASARG